MSGQGNGLGGCSSGWGCSAVLFFAAVFAVLIVAMLLMPGKAT